MSDSANNFFIFYPPWILLRSILPGNYFKSREPHLLSQGFNFQPDEMI